MRSFVDMVIGVGVALVILGWVSYEVTNTVEAALAWSDRGCPAPLFAAVSNGHPQPDQPCP